MYSNSNKKYLTYTITILYILYGLFLSIWLINVSIWNVILYLTEQMKFPSKYVKNICVNLLVMQLSLIINYKNKGQYFYINL